MVQDPGLWQAILSSRAMWAQAGWRVKRHRGYGWGRGAGFAHPCEGFRPNFATNLARGLDQSNRLGAWRVQIGRGRAGVQVHEGRVKCGQLNARQAMVLVVELVAAGAGIHRAGGQEVRLGSRRGSRDEAQGLPRQAVILQRLPQVPCEEADGRAGGTGWRRGGDPQLPLPPPKESREGGGGKGAQRQASAYNHLFSGRFKL